MKNSIFTVLAALVLYPAGAQPVTPQDRRRAAELVERMTLDEKICLLYTSPSPRDRG